MKLLCVLSLGFALTGCGGGSPAADTTEVYSVTGSLLVNGKPGTDAWVTLAADFEGVPSPSAKVGADGSFSMTVTKDDLNAFETAGDPVGEYFLLVRMPRDPSSILSPDKLGGAYSDPKVFRHPVSIELGENQLEPLRIENAKVAD